MLACNETVTLARCDGTNWETEVIYGASWFSKSVGAMTDRGMQGSREIHCRIPLASTPAMIPKINDYIIHGAVEKIAGISELKNQDFGRITNVSDNRRGRKSLQHISVVAS